MRKSERELSLVSGSKETENSAWLGVTVPLVPPLASLRFCEDALCAGTWRAEAIDREGDGDCFVVISSGPEAHSRATEYAAWMNS
jgi:hypothetical protein